MMLKPRLPGLRLATRLYEQRKLRRAYALSHRKHKVGSRMKAQPLGIKFHQIASHANNAYFCVHKKPLRTPLQNSRNVQADT